MSNKKNHIILLFSFLLNLLGLGAWAEQPQTSTSSGNTQVTVPQTPEPIATPQTPVATPVAPTLAPSVSYIPTKAKQSFYWGLGVSRFDVNGDATISFRDYEVYAPTFSFGYGYYPLSGETFSLKAHLEFSYVQFEEDDESSVSREVRDIPLLFTFGMPTIHSMIPFGTTFLSFAIKAEYYTSNLNDEELYRNQSYFTGMLGLTLASLRALDDFQMSLYFSFLTDYDETKNVGKTVDDASLIEFETRSKTSLFSSADSPYSVSFRYQRLLVDYKNSDDSILQNFMLGFNKEF